MEDHRFLILIKLIAIGTVVLTVTYILLVTYSDLAYIQPDEAQWSLVRSENRASKIAGASSSGAQSQREERLPLVAEKERQEEAARKDAERLALAAEKERQEEAAAQNKAARQALEAKKKRQEAAAQNEAERPALEAEKKRQDEAAAKKEAERSALEAEKKRQVKIRVR